MSAAKTIGSGALSGLSMVGNLLDLPGSMVRDALVWDNPLDQFKDPLSHSDTGRSATGRDVLSRNFLTSWLISPNKETGMSGWADDPMEGVRDVAGFGVELATDPLSWFTGGLAKTPSAASKLRHLGSLGAAIETTAKAGKLGKLEKGLNIINELDLGTHVGRALGIPQWVAARKLAKAAAAARAADAVAGGQYKTPEFKQWFGDWEADPVNSSKVVDAEGAPLVVYHGTGTPDLGVKAAKESNAKTRKAAEEWAAHDELEKTNEPLRKVALKSTELLKEKFGKDVTSVLTRSTKAPHIPWDVNAYDFSSPESLARSIYKTATNQEKELLWSRGVFREVDGKVSTNIDDSMLGTIRQSHSDWVNAESEFRRLSMKPKSQRPPKGWEDRLKSEDPSFDTTRSGANDHGYMSSGSYFTDSADEASGYATTTKTGTGGVIPVHLSLKNPFINGVSDSAPVESLASKILGKSITDATKRDPDEFSRAIALSRREALIELGYDGEIRRRSQAGDSKSFATDEYVAFYPEQIKSINNSGTYDPSDPNILASPSSAPASPRDFRSSQPATPDAPNQVTDSILGEASIEAPLSGGVAGTLDKIGDTLTSLDPGTHVGRFIRRKLGDLNKAVAQYGQKKTLTQLVDENITQRIAQSKLGKAAAQFKAALSPREVQLPNTQAVINANLTVQQELQSLIAGDSIARGSRVLTQLTEAQDLSKGVGAAFGADVLIWGGSKIPSKSGGVRRFAVGNRIWVNGDVQASELNSIVGHELLHLIRDVDNDAFHQIVDTINKHTAPDYLAKKTQEYIDAYKKVFKKDLHPGVAVEEGAARSVEAAFDRPAFWQELTADPKLEKKLRQVFTQAMDKLKGTLPAQEFEVLDKELSAFIFSKADQVRAGATDASIQTALGDRFLFNSNQPVADILATPGTKTHEVIDHAADLTSRINAGIKQAMNFKVGGHTYPVVQDFSKRRVDRLETLATDLSLPMLSAIETITKLASELPIDAQVARIAELDELVAQAIEKGDYSVLHRELHPAVRQMELVGRELLRLGITSGLKGKWLKDSYVNWFPHALHPKIQQKYNEAMAGKSSKSGADLGVSIKRTDAERTGLFREGFYGLTTWNEATTNPKAIDILSDEVRDFDERVKFAGNALRDEYIDDIDPRIPVMRDDKFQMIQKHPDGSLSPNPIPVSHSEMVRYARVDYTVAADGSRVPIDFNDVATRRDHHVNQPIEYTKTVKDADGNEIELQFELLTGRNDTRYGDTSPPVNPQQVADWGYYKDPIEQRDRFHVLSEFMADVGTDTLSETGGVFGGSALHNYGHAINTRAGQVTTVSEMPELLLGGMQDGSIVPMTGDRAKVGKYLQLGKLFDSPYFSIVDRSVVYQKLATLEPSLANLMTQMSSKEFSNMMDGMMIKPEIFKDLTEVGVYMKGHPALDTFMKPLQSATAATKAGWLTHPATHNRNLLSGLAQLVYGNLFSNSAGKTAYQVLYGQPSTELLHYGPIKKYLDRFELEHTPENATRAARVMFANYMKESGNIYSSQYADPTDFKADASNAASSILESMPGDGRSGFWDMMKGAAKTSIGREGDTSWNPFDISGVQRFFDKKDTAGKVIEKAGDVRAKTKFAPVAGSNIIGKHVNDVTRMAGWLEGMRRGNSADGAWKAVDFNQINYNPRTFGPVESKILKKVFPFYSFMSRETAWVAHELMTNPSGRLGKMIRLGRHANSTNQNEYLPEHISEGLSVPISGHRTDGVQQYLTGLGFMFEDSIKMAGNVMSGTKDISRDLLSKSNPLIKAPAEWGLGRSSFQGGPMGGRDIEDMDPVLGRIFTQLGLQAKKEGGQAAPAFGSRGLEFVLSNSPVSRILSSSKTLLDDRKSLLSRASNVLTGIKITSVSPEQRQRGLREILNARAKELGARPFTTLHISKSMLEAAKANEANDPELYQEMLLISNKRKQLDKSQRIKRKAAATP